VQDPNQADGDCKAGTQKQQPYELADYRTQRSKGKHQWQSRGKVPHDEWLIERRAADLLKTENVGGCIWIRVLLEELGGRPILHEVVAARRIHFEEGT
jgi:hypothetical protein